jgi:tetratricopeptide (TPR) repeat protein
MPPSLQSVVADNAKEYPNKMKFKSFGDEALAVPENVISAFALYDQHKYNEAAKALQPIVAANGDRMDYRFYWGVSLVKSEQYAAAVTALTPVTQSQDERRIPALYYLGLSCAGTGDKDCARQSLQSYIDSPEGVTFRKEAQAVKKAL